MLLKNKLSINLSLKLNERSESPSDFAILFGTVLSGCHEFVVKC